MGLGKSCAPSRRFCRRPTAVTSLLSLWVIGNRHVRGSCKLRGQKKEKKLTKNSYQKKLLNLSRAIQYKKPDVRQVPVLSNYLVKLVNIGFSRHIKTGCQLPVCINRNFWFWHFTVYVKLLKVGLGISRTNADSQWNPAYNAFRPNFCCGNETICR